MSNTATTVFTHVAAWRTLADGTFAPTADLTAVGSAKLRTIALDATIAAVVELSRNAQAKRLLAATDAAAAHLLSRFGILTFQRPLTVSWLRLARTVEWS